MWGLRGHPRRGPRIGPSRLTSGVPRMVLPDGTSAAGKQTVSRPLERIGEVMPRKSAENATNRGVAILLRGCE